MWPNFTPQEVLLDDHAHAKGVKGQDKTLPAKTILIAAGTKPNTILAEEGRGVFLRRGLLQTPRRLFHFVGI